MAPLSLRWYYRLCCCWPGIWLSCLLLVAISMATTAWIVLLPHHDAASPVSPEQRKLVRYEAADPHFDQLAAPYLLNRADASKQLLQIMQQAGVLGTGVQFQVPPQAALLLAQGEVRTTYTAWSQAMALLSQKLPFARLQSVALQQQENTPGVYLVRYQLQLPLRRGQP